MKLCAHLRWKSFYGASFANVEEAVALARRNEVPFQCNRSCRPWGPDDLPAVPELCDDARPCFEPSPLFPEPEIS